MEWVVIFTEVAQYIRYIGVWGGYVAMFIFIFLTAYLLPVFKVQTGYLGTFGSGLGLTFAYFCYAGLNVFVHEFFAPELQLWQLYFKKVVDEGRAAGDDTEKKTETEAKEDDAIEEGVDWNEPTDSFNLEVGQWNRKVDHDLWANQDGIEF